MSKIEKNAFLQVYQEMCDFHGINEKTTKERKQMILVFLEYCEENGIDWLKPITPEIMKGFFGERAALRGGVDLGKETMKRYVWILNDGYRECLRLRKILFNPIENLDMTAVLPVRLRGRKPKPLAAVLTEREFRLMINASSEPSQKFHIQRKRVAILLACCCGLRNTEIRELLVSQVHLNETMPYVQVVGKFKKERIIPIPQNLQAQVQYLLSLRQVLALSDEYLLSDKKGKIYDLSSLTKMVHNEMAALGIYKSKMSPHVLRHTYCSALFARNVPLRKIMLLMGHEDVKVTMKYEHTGMYGGKDLVLEGYDMAHGSFAEVDKEQEL